MPSNLLGTTSLSCCSRYAWSVIAMRALVGAMRQSIAEWRGAARQASHIGLPVGAMHFLSSWCYGRFSPIGIFSLSRSKCPSATSCPYSPLTFLTATTQTAMRHKGAGVWAAFAARRAVPVTIHPGVLLPWHTRSSGSPAASQHFATAISSGVARHFHPGRGGSLWGERLRVATMVPLVVMLLFIFGVGPFLAFPLSPLPRKTSACWTLPTLPARWPPSSARFARPNEVVAVYRVRRDVEYVCRSTGITRSKIMSKTASRQESTF